MVGGGVVSATADRASVALEEGGGAAAPTALAPASGLELLGPVDGSGYEDGANLVRRADGQMVQLGPLMYALLEEVDGERDTEQLASAMCERLGRACDEQVVVAIARKLAQQGLLAGSEANAPERANPLLALRWKVVVSDPAVTRRLTAPFTTLFRPWILLPVLAGFLAVCWFVLVEKGVASAAAEAFDRPELILLLFALGVGSAGFHELGHATACRYGGGTPGAMGAGIYLVWPAFYTDVTDAYRLPTRARLRTDLGGLYFNAIVAVAAFGAWAVLRVDSLLLLIGLQLLGMVKQLSPVIRADGYHILADVTGVPDLYAHIGPTLRRLVPGRAREASALTGRARLIVTLWVLVIVPVLLLTTLSAVLLLPKLAASTWESASNVLGAMPDQGRDGHVVDLLVSVLRLMALTLPVIGITLMVRRLVMGAGRRAVAWSGGRPTRRAAVVLFATAATCLAAWAWWPSGQYRPIRSGDGGRILQVHQLVSARTSAPHRASGAATGATAGAARGAHATPVTVPAGTHLAVSLIPEGGATEEAPAIFVMTDPKGGTPIVVTSTTAPPVGDAPTAEGSGSGAASAATPADPSTGDATTTAPTTTSATAFAFDLPDKPGPRDSQALAVNRTDGGTTYSIAYSLVTVHDGDAVDERNGAHAYANCQACTTVAVSFQVVLVVGTSRVITPINVAEALNGNCPRCVTTAIANQIVVTVASEPSDAVLAQLNAELQRLDALDDLGADARPADIAAQVEDVRQGINRILTDSGLVPSGDAQDPAAADPADTTPGDATDQATPDGTDPATDPAADPNAPAADPVDPATTDPATTDPATGSTGGTTDGSATGGTTTTTTPPPSDTTTAPPPTTSTTP
ncbi:MAG: hypothetical protein JWM98_2495 [Thermoleophilia bacterium]|nr:hypothetical protein [Thermoleophilia bacterium]